ncbi:hypothetical protein GNP79_08160 [Aliivibrio fischeri]|uniref:ParE-like toxin domain-containing protein n=1 Tax=Aliivibrio fischeri TaxID=668 RepID=A0A6N3YUF7_ALIFS|nr:hypothetical protein [Aliivibrio fischeri]MUK45122.1 hypothetical protein [Aliivibrio fischeri]MUK80781.1 hypothetical protein [Aliivibrio fischeri]MUK84210.1 hypothetical protein [Aliivibrio fischeri]
MNQQQITVESGVKIKIITPKAPPLIINRAKKLISKIFVQDILRGMRPKVIQRNKKWLSYRVNRKYRLLVLRTRCNTGPYYCLSHTEFDHWVNNH